MLSNYDTWLNAPMEHMMDETERYADWCEAHEVDPDDPEAENAYDDWISDLYESYAEAKAEAAMERRYDAAMERDWDESY